MAVYFPRKHFQTSGRQEVANLDVRSYFEQAPMENAPSWLSNPEIPTPAEVLGTDTPDDYVCLNPNVIDGPWESKEQYIEAHYKLLREDSVAPLRDAVGTVRSNPSMNDGRDISIYENVFVTGITLARAGLALHLQFSTRRAGKNIAWAFSDRLRPGTLVALTPVKNWFHSECIVGIVASRKIENVTKDPPEVDIYLASYQDINPDPQQEWLMVESRVGYYEASKHTMKALQKLYTESFPLNEHICSLDTDIGVPEYIQSQPTLNFQSLSQQPNQGGLTYNIIERWPVSPIGQLDEFQWAALREMLTQKLAITQGPPGTGKTFTSLAALKVLLSNKQPNDPPIVVAAQTNHALDQLLKQVSEFEQNYVRMGSRSTDFEIKKRTIWELRRDNLTPKVTGGLSNSSQSHHSRLSKEIAELLKPLTHIGSDKPMTLAMVLYYGLLREDQVESLLRTHREWQRAADSDPFQTWLGDAVIKFEYPLSGNFGFEDDDWDLEYEQLKELEMENGVHEETWSNNKDTFVQFAPGWCGEGGEQISPARIATLLEQTDLWSISRRYRGAIYDHLRNNLLSGIISQVLQKQEEYEHCVATNDIGRYERDHPVLRDANLIGLTTTGLSKYRGLLASVNPRVILIEEAAEVIEAPIAVACLPSIQHLILVGDHRQLRGHCAIVELAKPPFNLEVSMFERLVSNGMNFNMLQEQRRMIPEIRRLVDSLYGNTLRDHPSVGDRPLIPGLGSIQSYFFDHNQHESSDSLSSYVNEFEASMVIGMLEYLLKNGVPPKEITILTFYRGQLKLIKRTQNKNPFTSQYHVEIATVDSYQGEENNIILLSLVRSNDHRGIGFLEQVNRACVALSRARNGLFIFGDANCISNRSSFWQEVANQMYTALPTRVGRALPLFCERHQVRTLIKKVADWHRIEGGCDQPCGDNLPCGHACPSICHGTEHDWVSCEERCNMVCQSCDEPCSETCAPPHDHKCSCTFLNDPKALSKFKISTRRRKEPRSNSGTTISEESSLTPVRGRSLTRRYTANFGRDQPVKKDQAKERKEAATQAVKRWNDFAGHGAIEDDHRRAGIPVPQHLRRPTQPLASTSLRPQPTNTTEHDRREAAGIHEWVSNDHSRETATAKIASEADVAALQPTVADEEKLLIEFD